MAMREERFWTIIEESLEANEEQSGGLQDFVGQVEARLEELEEDDIAAFQQQMLNEYLRAYTHGLIAAGFVILGEDCDDDDLHGFRGWLIAQGKEYFDQAVADPDSLADDDDLIRDEIYLPEILDIGSEVYERFTGELPPADPDFELPTEPGGDAIEVEQIPERLPKLCEEWAFDLGEEEVDDDAQDEVGRWLAETDLEEPIEAE